VYSRGVLAGADRRGWRGARPWLRASLLFARSLPHAPLPYSRSGYHAGRWGCGTPPRGPQGRSPPDHQSARPEQTNTRRERHGLEQGKLRRQTNKGSTGGTTGPAPSRFPAAQHTTHTRASHHARRPRRPTSSEPSDGQGARGHTSGPTRRHTGHGHKPDATDAHSRATHSQAPGPKQARTPQPNRGATSGGPTRAHRAAPPPDERTQPRRARAKATERPSRQANATSGPTRRSGRTGPTSETANERNHKQTHNTP
jgi:hypothetical protein